MTIFQEIISKILEMPDVADQIRQSLVNRDLAIEIDGKKYQIMKKRNDKELEDLKKELETLKVRLYDVEGSLRNIIDVHKRNCSGPELSQAWEHAERLMGN